VGEAIRSFFSRAASSIAAWRNIPMRNDGWPLSVGQPRDGARRGGYVLGIPAISPCSRGHKKSDSPDSPLVCIASVCSFVHSPLGIASDHGKLFAKPPIQIST
jgi:hypothetical protein